MTDLFDDIEPVTDTEPDPDTSRTDGPSGGPTCEVCGTDIPWSGRGRKPKKCEDHKARTSSRSDTGAPTRGTRLDKRLAVLTEDLTSEFTKVGKGMAPFLPVTGIVAVSRAPKTAEAMVKIAARNAKVLTALETVTKVMPAFELGETGAMIGTALAVDRKFVHPDSAIPVMLGVSEIWHDLYPDEQQQESPNGKTLEGEIGLPTQTVPPRFAKIT